MLWPISSAGGTNCSCTQSWTGCQQQVTTYFQLHKSDSRIICVACLSAPSHLSEIGNSACACSQTSSHSRFTDQCWSISFSVHLSTVLGVWHSDDPGWKTQEVSSLSRGVHLCCAQPLFGRCHPVPLLAAAHRPLPLTLTWQDFPLRYSSSTHAINSLSLVNTDSQSPRHGLSPPKQKHWRSPQKNFFWSKSRLKPCLGNWAHDSYWIRLQTSVGIFKFAYDCHVLRTAVCFMDVYLFIFFLQEFRFTYCPVADLT